VIKVAAADITGAEIDDEESKREQFFGFSVTATTAVAYHVEGDRE
jgi:hypothetical protein